MSKYELLTKHISTFESNNFGEWFVDKENDGSTEHKVWRITNEKILGIY